MSMCDKSYCYTNCNQKDCERNLNYNKPPTNTYYSATTFDIANDIHEKCPWKIKKQGG